MKKIIIFLSSFLFIFLSSSTRISAEITNPVVGKLGFDSGKATSGSTTLSYFVTLWRTIITVGGILVLLYFLWGSIDWITSGGDSGKVTSARNKIVQAVIGMILLAFSFVIVGFISQLAFGGELDLLNLTFPTP